MSKKKRTKKDNERFHATRRLDERYGLRLTQYMRDFFRCAVKSNGAFFVRRQSNRVSIFDIVYRVHAGDTDDPFRVGEVVTIRFAYDRNRREVITMLPRDEEEQELQDGDGEPEKLPEGQLQVSEPDANITAGEST